MNQTSQIPVCTELPISICSLPLDWTTGIEADTDRKALLVINRETPPSRHSSSQYKQMNTTRSKPDALSKLLLLRKWLLAEKILTQVRQISPECIKESKCIK